MCTKSNNSMSDIHLRILEKEKITCIDLEALMGDYADRDLSDSLKFRLDQHLNECEECSKFKTEYLATINIAKTLKPAPMDSEIQVRLRRALNERLGLNLSENNS